MTEQPIPQAIPSALRELGVVGVTKYQSGYDVRYSFDFADGKHLTYDTAHNRFDAEHNMLADMVSKIRLRRMRGDHNA